MLWWLFRWQDSVESAFIKGRDFKSIWHASFSWLGLDPNSADPSKVPQEAAELIHKIILGFLKQDLMLRRRGGRRVLHESMPLLFWDENYYRVKLWDCLTKGTYDKELLSNIYVERANLLHWCEKELMPPPPFWAPQIEDENIAEATAENADDDNDSWYDALTDRRKQRVTCLEVAKRLWKINPNRTYEEVFSHPDMKQYGYPNSFSFNAFKKWARAFAPDYAKNGGRRKESVH
jgi:hypothetical protein